MPEPRGGLPHEHRRARRPDTTRALTRSRDRVLGGVVGGLAAYLETDANRLRWLTAAAITLTLGVGVIPYLLLWAMLPGAPEPD